MRNRTLIILILTALLALSLLAACGSARPADEDTADRLVGVFVTREHLNLFDMDGYLNDHAGKIVSGGELDEEDTAKYQNRLYAALDEEDGRQSFRFEGVEGYSYFAAEYTDEAGHYTGSSGDEAFSDGKMAISSTDAGESVTLEATIYVSTDGPTLFYFNPVYQTATGEVYATTGNGSSIGAEFEEGMSHTTTLSENRKLTTGAIREEAASTVSIKVEYMSPPESIAIVEIDKEGTRLSRSEYAPDALPEQVEPESESAYIIVETKARSGEIRRELFERTEDALTAFFCREDGICVKKSVPVCWAQ